MRHSRWLHILCVAGPLSALLLLVAGLDRGVALLAWLLCPIAMIWMIRHHSGSARGHDHAPAIDTSEDAGHAHPDLLEAPTVDAHADDRSPPDRSWPGQDGFGRST